MRLPTALALALALLAPGLALSAGCLFGERPQEGRPLRHVVLVSFDTVRADRLSLHGHERPTSRSIERLARRGVTFDRAFSPSNESLYSHAALFSGLYVSEVADPVYRDYAVPDSVATLAEALSFSGWRTAAFSGGGHVRREFGFAQGFDPFEVPAAIGPRFGSFFHTVPAALAWIDRTPADQPWLVLVHSYDAHEHYVKAGPYHHRFDPGGATPAVERLVRARLGTQVLSGDTWYPDRTPADLVHASGMKFVDPEVYSSLAEPRSGERTVRLSPEEVEHLRSHYDNGVAYGDQWLGVLFAGLEDRGLLDDTLVIVLSDHGEDLLDHGFVNHRTGVWDSCTRVPLVVAGPGFPAGERFSGLVDLRSVVPTVLHAAGVKVPAGVRAPPLQDVLSGAAGAAEVFAEGVLDTITVRTPTHRLVVRGFVLADPASLDALRSDPVTAERFDLYDTVRDPKEQVDLLAAGLPAGPNAAAVAEELRGRLVRWRESLAPAVSGRAFRTAPAALERELRDKGYFDPAKVGSDAGRKRE